VIIVKKRFQRRIDFLRSQSPSRLSLETAVKKGAKIANTGLHKRRAQASRAIEDGVLPVTVV
jgi:hypothetical protein